MLKARILPLLVVAAFALLLPQAPAHAQARSWVSGTGTDSGTCTRAAPCKTFAFALTQTAAGGEIFALDGGEFDGLTISKAITIDGGGRNASVHSTSLSAILVSANPGDTVILRNLHIRGDGTLNGNGANGIAFESGGLLSIEGCTISGTANTGIDVGQVSNATLNIFNTTITDAGIGIFIQPSGPLSGVADHVTIQHPHNTGSGGFGIQAAGSVAFTVTGSNILNAPIAAIQAASGAVVDVDSSSVSNNNIAFAVNGGFIAVSGSTSYNNNTTFLIGGGGGIFTFGDNVGVVNGATKPSGTAPKF